MERFTALSAPKRCQKPWILLSGLNRMRSWRASHASSRADGPRVEGARAKAAKKHLDGHIAFLDYDWRLNEQR